MAQRIIGIAVGLVVAIVTIMAIQMLSHQIYPFPEGLDLKDKPAVQAHMADAPMSAMLVVLAGYIVAAFLGGLAATKMGKEYALPALIVGGLLTVGAIANSIMIPQPLWLSAGSVVLMIPLALLGGRMVKSSR